MTTGKRISVDDTTTLLHQAPVAAGATVTMFNSGPNPVDVGGPSVTFGAGYQLNSGQAAADHVSFSIRAGESLYAIAGVGVASTVHILVAGE